MIHAVGRASPRAPRLIDLTWGREGARTVTLVGKGITFDTGGLDIKPSSAMLLMKKDMGGAAAVLTLGHMIMAQKLDVRLRILIPTAENSISGDAFRPGDVLKSRAGTTVEIGNTDAEGRLVLADAMALADEESPQSLFVFATLTGRGARRPRPRPAGDVHQRRCVRRRNGCHFGRRRRSGMAPAAVAGIRCASSRARSPT